MKYTKYNTNKFEIHSMALDLVKSNSSVLELGCATGYYTRELLKKNCTVIGIDSEKEAIRAARKINKNSILGDLNYPQHIKVGRTFDYVLCLDVIEHLVQREEMLNFVKRKLNSNGTLILSTPNIAHVKVRVRLLMGVFDYEKIGIMDTTHLHFYTRKTIINEIKLAGFRQIEVFPSVDLGQVPLFGKLLRKLPKVIQKKIVDIDPELFAVQFLIIAKH